MPEYERDSRGLTPNNWDIWQGAGERGGVELVGLVLGECEEHPPYDLGEIRTT